MQMGDKVRVVAGGGQEGFFDDGCVGTLTEPSGEKGWWVDFNTQDNAPGTFCPDSGGVWAVSEHNLVLVSVSPASSEVAQLQARVAELEAALREYRAYTYHRDAGNTLSQMRHFQKFESDLERLLP